MNALAPPVFSSLILKTKKHFLRKTVKNKKAQNEAAAASAASDDVADVDVVTRTKEHTLRSHLTPTS